MAETSTGTTSKKPKAEVTQIKMEDGRVVGFAGTRKMDKDYLIDLSKIESDNGSIVLQEGAVQAVIDFRNGKSIKFPVPLTILAQAAGHGIIQKLGDEAAGEKDVDDAFLAVDDLAQRLASGEWTVAREAGGFSGASTVLQAILEAKREQVPDYTLEQVKAGLQAILDKDAARAEAEGRKPITRQALYASFRNPTTKVGKIVKRIEEEKAAKSQSAVDADAAVEAL